MAFGFDQVFFGLAELALEVFDSVQVSFVLGKTEILYLFGLHTLFDLGPNLMLLVSSGHYFAPFSSDLVGLEIESHHLLE